MEDNIGDTMEKRRKIKIMLVTMAVIAGLSFMALVPIQQQVQEGRVWHVQRLRALGDFDPGDGEGGFIRIVIKDLTAGSIVPNSNASVAVNMTDIDSDDFSEEITHSVVFGIFVFARYNTTEAYDAAGGAWEPDWTRVKITSATLDIAADTIMNNTVVDESPDYLWMCHWLELDSTDARLMLARDESADITQVQREAFY